MRCLIFLILSVLFVQNTAAQESLRVATFNINLGNVDLPDITRTIIEAGADLI
jgi:hypothetical protein